MSKLGRETESKHRDGFGERIFLKMREECADKPISHGPLFQIIKEMVPGEEKTFKLYKPLTPEQLSVIRDYGNPQFEDGSELQFKFIRK